MTPDSEQFDELYEELRRIAARLMPRHNTGTLQATALVHEAFLKLHGRDDWASNRHYVLTAAKAMRQVLIDNARRKKTAKRGGGLERLQLGDLAALLSDPDLCLDLDGAIDALEAESSEYARLVELRVFGGLSILECAAVLQLTEDQLKDRWAYVRARLRGLLADHARHR